MLGHYRADRDAAMSALGLGRVITLQLGLRVDATGQLYRDTADLSTFSLR